MTSRKDSYLPAKPRHRSPRNPSSLLPTRLADLGTHLRGNQDLLRNASSLAATTGVTSVLGFGFWIYAARVFSAEAVGYASAAISTMLLLGTLGMFGLDTMLIGELPRGGNRGGLTMAACIVAFGVSFVLGLGFSLVSLAFGSHFAELNGTVGRIALFSFGVGITGATLVFDAATIGLLRGGLQLSRNVSLSIAKMAILPAAGLVLHDRFGVGIILAWVIGIVVSLLPVAILIKHSGGKVFYRPDWANLWRLRRLALAHNWLNLAINIPARLVTVLVAVVVPPAANGAYYIANMISSFLSMVPGSLSTVLFAVASAAPEKIAEKLRFVLRMSLLIGIPGGLAMGLSGRFVLSAFGPSYAALAAGPLWIMVAGYIPVLFSTTYIAVARAFGRFNRAAVFLTVFATIRMAALLVGGKLDGLYGLSYAMLAVLLLQCALTAPLVLRTAFGGPLLDSVAADTAQPPSAAEPAEKTRVKQEEGLAALIALATRVGPSQHGSGAMAAATAGAPMFPASPRPQTAVHGRSRHRRPAFISVTRAERALTDTDRWGEAGEQAPGVQLETGMATLIEIATRAADL